MKILVNGTSLLAPLTGIGQYVRHLFSAMTCLPKTEIHTYYGRRFELGFRLPSPDTAQTMQHAYGVWRRFLPHSRALRWTVERRLFAWGARGFSRDCLYHEPGFLALPHSGPLVVSVHDLSCFDHPEMHPAERVRLMRRELPTSIKRADRVIVISESTALALRRWFDVPPERISITHLAADRRYRPRPEASLVAPLAGLDLQPGGYLLSVGTLEPRKNLRALFEAYAGLPESLRRRFPLAVAGMSGWHHEEAMRASERLIARGELRLLGYVPDALLPKLYAGAAAFAYPSRYEGFGLPPLEAMASGAPVITSNATSLPEVVGDAGLMVDPDDVDGLRAGLLRLLDDRTLADDLARRGLERSRCFDWQRCARETRAIYAEVLRERGLYGK